MANNDWKTGSVLVIGGTGKSGRRVVERLKKTGRQVRIGSRRETPGFDWENAATWRPALDGMSAAFVTYQPDFAVPGGVETAARFFLEAVDSGVTKLVLVSGRGEPEAEAAEQALRASGADWTILRSSWFAQNFSESFFLESILAGEVVLPEGLAAEPFVDVEDIADIGAAALADPQHSNQYYELSGPRAFTFSDAIAQIAQATGREIAFVPIPVSDYRAEMVRQKVPDGYVEIAHVSVRGRPRRSQHAAHRWH